MTALIKVQKLCKYFGSGETKTCVLREIDLEITAGEMVAIVGQSGSGKSTLMHILGCLDRPSSGDYWLDGNHIDTLTAGAQARLRREYIGFIFQRYHLLNDLSARENVAIPALYAGVDRVTRLLRADQLLERLGLGARKHHKPQQLSGGQQQRVSIARALINGGKIILADEPTGALDSESGAEVMNILRELHQQGHTIILVTHDAHIAEQADRIIELKDGVILSDTVRNVRPFQAPELPQKIVQKNRFSLKTLASAFSMAIRAILGHKLRSFLTMLGIIIGIASVVSMVALGQGSQQQVLSRIQTLGSNTIQVFSGAFGDPNAWRVQTLSADDATLLAQQSFVDSATPILSLDGAVRTSDRTLTAIVTGIGRHYFQVQNMPIIRGAALAENDIRELKAVAYIDEKSAQQLFPHSDPLGAVMVLDNVAVTIIGVVDTQNHRQFRNTNAINLFMPYTSVMSRLLGSSRVSQIMVRIRDGVESTVAEDAISRILIRRHGSKDFTLFNNDSLRQVITQTSKTLSLLIAAIAVISLIVGGIGVMNIMLVSVTERTQEIGIRMAVGARRQDILQQFLIEAVLLCLFGGIIGISLAFGIGQLIALSGAFTMIYSLTSVVIAFGCASGIGILFGYLPAKNAAKLDPVQALAHD